VTGFGLYVLTAYGLSRRVHKVFEDLPISSDVSLITLIACYFAVGPDPRRPRRWTTPVSGTPGSASIVSYAW